MRILYIMINIESLNFNRNRISIIPQVCNNIGLYGAGYSGAISRRWPIVQEKYLEWYRKNDKINGTTGPFALGNNQYVNCGGGIIVVNMIAMSGVRSRFRTKPLVETELMACLFKLSQLDSKNSDFYFAKIGSGLAGGDWNLIKYFIETFLNPHDFNLIYI